MRRVLVAALVLSVTVLLGTTPVHAQTVPPITSFDPDGEPCTGVPDAIPGVFDFTAACTQHDACYAEGVDRLACDVAFRTDMIEACQAQHPDVFDPRRYRCLTFAELYFIGVRLFGGAFFPPT